MAKLILVLTSSAAASVNGQFLRSGGFKSYASSWVSSSSWVLDPTGRLGALSASFGYNKKVHGRDGQMHQQVQEMRTETFGNDGETVKRTQMQRECKDGLCQESVSIARPGSVEVIATQVGAPRGVPAPSGLVPVRLQDMRRWEMPQVTVGVLRAPQPVYRPVYVRAPVPYLFAPVAGLAASVLSLLGLIAASVVKFYRAGSRELPLLSLSEPLAEQPLAPAVPPASPATPQVVAAPQAVAAAAAGACLKDIYVRAAAAAELATTKAYLARLYDRATA